MGLTWNDRAGMLIGCCVRRHRLLANLTQRELGKLVGSDRAIVARLERGVHNVTIETLAFYVDALGIPWVELFACLDEAGTPPKDAYDGGKPL